MRARRKRLRLPPLRAAKTCTPHLQREAERDRRARARAAVPARLTRSAPGFRRDASPRGFSQPRDSRAISGASRHGRAEK
jgi:hypothetical protein